MRKGFAFIITMMMLVIISSFSAVLWASARDNALISGNARRHTLAKISAQSGLNHFMALNLYSQDLRAAANDRPEITVIDRTSMPGTRQEYEVKVRFCCESNGDPLPENKFFVISIGSYRAGGRISSQASLISLVETREILQN